MTSVAHLRFFGKQTEQFCSLNAGKGIYSFICFIIEQDVNLYAEVNGKVMPVTRSTDDAKYQVCNYL